MAKMTNTKSLVSGALLKWSVSVALLVILILLITSNVIVADSIIMLVAAVSMLVPTAIGFGLYFSWYNKYVPKKTDDNSSRVEVYTEGLNQTANTKSIVAIILNLVFAIVGAILTSFLNIFGDTALIIVYLIVSAIIFSAIDFVIFHINSFKPNN